VLVAVAVCGLCLCTVHTCTNETRLGLMAVTVAGRTESAEFRACRDARYKYVACVLNLHMLYIISIVQYSNSSVWQRHFATYVGAG
jgi:hypothetical protein